MYIKNNHMAEVLNLVNPNDRLSFKYEISKFPDGQQSLRLVEQGYNTFQSLRDSDEAHGIRIYSRLNTFQDLEIIICATQALREIGVKRISLYIPYCMGARSDRKFMEGGINYVKNVIAPIINSQGYEEVQILDPHSDVLEACINNFKKVGTTDLINYVLKDYFVNIKGVNRTDYSNLLLLSPDAGALKKVYGVAESIGYNGDIIVASKHRNIETGKIDYTHVPMLPNHTDKDIFIIDDICDGGRTFIEIAKVIKENKEYKGNLYLVVTHGIFSAGFDFLVQYFDGIYTTNSVKDVQDGTIVDTFSRHKTIHSFVKQLNVF